VQERINSAREQCAALQDTLDAWIAAGRDLDAIACWWIQDQQGKSERPAKLRRRKSKDGSQRMQGLRKRCLLFLESQVGSTGFDVKEIGKALQYFALEQSAAWISNLKSERKARELKSLARWYWEGCKLSAEGMRSIKAIHSALADAKWNLSAKQIRETVDSIIGRVAKPVNLARKAAQAFFDAIEGTDRQDAAERSAVLSWLAVLLRESPVAAEVLTTAVETHLDELAAAEKVSKAA
jgi:hypothetical protein